MRCIIIIIIILSNHRNTGPERGKKPHDEDARLAHTLAHGRTPAAPFSKTQEEHEPPTVTT